MSFETCKRSLRWWDSGVRKSLLLRFTYVDPVLFGLVSLKRDFLFFVVTTFTRFPMSFGTSIVYDTYRFYFIPTRVHYLPYTGFVFCVNGKLQFKVRRCAPSVKVLPFSRVLTFYFVNSSTTTTFLLYSNYLCPTEIFVFLFLNMF